MLGPRVCDGHNAIWMSDGTFRGSVPWLGLCPDNQKYGRSHNGQSILSPKYRDAKTMASLLLRKAKGKQTAHTKPVEVVYDFHVPDLRRRDCANYIKLLSDALEGGEVVADDTLIHRSLIVRASLDRKAPRVDIYLRPLATTTLPDWCHNAQHPGL